MQREFHSRCVNETHAKPAGRIQFRLNIAQIADHACLEQGRGQSFLAMAWASRVQPLNRLGTFESFCLRERT